MSARLISITSPKITIDNQTLTPEGLIAYCARVSSPKQENPSYAHLLKYCINHRHWSIFEMVDMTVEITTSRAIAQQILRHRSFFFQEFSQRYAKVQDIETTLPRRQDQKNRQNSIEDLEPDVVEWFQNSQQEINDLSMQRYEEALEKGIAKESARFLLPLATRTRLYMKGSVRSWIHYLEVRTDPSTQKEHREIALEIMTLFKQEFPIITEALAW